MSYKKYESIYTGYQNSTDKDAYLRIHENRIILFEAVRESLGTENSGQSLESIPMLKNRIKEFTSELNLLVTVLHEHRKKVFEVNQMKSNLEIYMKISNKMSQKIGIRNLV